MREHREENSELDFVPFRQTINASYSDGATEAITLHDESVIYLHKPQAGPSINDRRMAIDALEDHKAKGRLLTGVLYINPESQDTHDLLNTCPEPLNSLGKDELCPGAAVLGQINEAFR